MSRVCFKDSREYLVRSEDDESTNFTFLSAIDRVDSFPHNYEQNEHFKRNVYMLQSHTGVDIGFVLGLVVKVFGQMGSAVVEQLFEINKDLKYVRFKPSSFNERNALFEELSESMKLRSGLQCIGTWRDEKYSVFLNHEPYVLVERGLAGAFGIVTYGVHVNGYVEDIATGKIKFWVPRRSASKSTWPSMLDNIVAGGIGYPYGIYETVFKECMEEASLTREEVETNIKCAGVLSYLFFEGDISKDKFEKESNYITGEVEYIYDLRLPHTIIPKPNDGEVEEFHLLTLQETIDSIKNREFKPNCALVMVDFLIRHGYITPETEPNYSEIVLKMHRRLPFPVRD